MKLYDNPYAPNPRRVRVFLAEKSIEIPRIAVDILKGEQRTPQFTALNPRQAVPVLELDDGTAIAESIAICRYFEELKPEPPLFGSSTLERAQVEMWQRRIELGLMAAIGQFFRHSHPLMANVEVPQIASWAEANRARALKFLPTLERQLADRPFVCGEAFTVADITGLVALDFMKFAGIPLPDDSAHVRRWHQTLAARPSAAA
ncbi:MAG TPA: glutathione S-transferase [Xanthobacteraceae bacterium]|nr:glutathione S-transferase [Xanthobacteraceae bacterium]